MKKIFFTIVMVSLFSAQSLFAISVRAIRTVDLGVVENSIADASFESVNTKLNDVFTKYGSTADFATASSNTLASTYNTATYVGFQDYDYFSVSTGFMISSSGIFLDGDTYSGSGSIAGNVGINADWLLQKFDIDLKDKNRFYLNIKFGIVPFVPGSMKEYDLGTTEMAFDSSMFGIGANYSIIEQKSFEKFGLDLAKWKGVSLGTGIYYTSQDLSLTQDVDITSGYVYYKGNVPFKMSSSTVTIPFEALTAVQLLIFNLSVGAGVDLNIGSTTLSADPSDVVRTNADIPGYLSAGEELGRIDIDVEDGSASILRAKIMGGIGILLGPVKIEVPFYYYPTADVAFGITIGAVW
jgi:hypothetical protein